MSNQKTAEEWKTVRDEAQREIDRVRPLLRQATIALKNADDRFNTLSAQENQLSGDPTKVAEYQAARNARIEYHRNFVLPAENAEQQLRDELNAAQRDYNYSSEQITIAQSGPPNTNTNTPPASAEPGNPTQLTTPPVEPIENDSAFVFD